MNNENNYIRLPLLKMVIQVDESLGDTASVFQLHFCGKLYSHVAGKTQFG